MKKDSRNKLTDFFIVIINVFFVVSLFLGEFFYIRSSNNRTRESNQHIFINTNISLGSMTNNYLIGESHLCRSWSNYLNWEADAGNALTIQEAVDFVSESIVDKDVMGHVIYKTGSNAYKGYSTRAKSGSPTDYSVDYTSLASTIFATATEGMNITPSYMNPINISKSLAFYTDVKLEDPDDPTKQVDGYLLRVVLSKNLQDEWVFPSGSFDHMEVAIIDSQGSYVINGSSFGNTNFYEYYSVCNKSTTAEVEELKNKITKDYGSLVMSNYAGEKAFIAYSQVDKIEDWTILTYIPLVDINAVQNDWLVIAIIGVGLGLLFVFDLVVLLILNKNLKSTAKVADSANKAKTDFLSTMSHDIRTPMNAIVGLTTIARKDNRNPNSTQDALKKIESASNHLLTLINDILDISKVESGKISINPISFCVVDTFENIINISQPMVKAKHIDFNFRVRNFDHEWLYADELRLSQIFTNLLSNALKYTNEGGKTTVYLEEKPSEKEGYTKLVYVVEDNGIGMSQEFIEKMYTPFSRATDSRVNKIQGTGLGLAITKQMVDLMNGTIECQSEVNKGTTFTVTIDLPIGEKPKGEISLPPIDILIVDDDEIALESAKDTIISLGANVDTASNVEDALNLLKKKEYRVIILDWVMPGIDGVELAKQVRELGHDTPIILVSAYDWTEIESEAKDAGINGFVFKPLFRSKICESILNLIENNASTTQEETETINANILIVEDNEINWEVASTLLGMYGATCERAENGKVAYEMIKEKGNDCPYDLVFMDIQMPVMNGLDATRAIRQLDFEYAKKVPIIAMTADAFSENIAECLEAGMNGHIAKPIDPKIMLSEIRKNVKK